MATSNQYGYTNPPPMTASTSYNAGYQNNYLQPPTTAPYNPQNVYASSTISQQAVANTPGLPPIPPPSRLEEFGNLSLTGINPNIPPVQTSFANPTYGQLSTSQGMTHSVFPLAQTGTYNNYSYNPQNPREPTTSSWWLYIAICLLILGLIIVGLWYFLIHRKTVKPFTQSTVITNQSTRPLITSQPYQPISSIQPIRTVTQTITSTQNRYGTANSVDSLDQNHHYNLHLTNSHLRHWIA